MVLLDGEQVFFLDYIVVGFLKKDDYCWFNLIIAQIGIMKNLLSGNSPISKKQLLQ